jgi:coenzyme Q-binding protein COQ10
MTRRVPYTAAQMFDLVADVERYPEFLPLCESLAVTSRAEQGGKTVLVATMGVGYKAIRERFTTRVTLDPAGLKIVVEYLDGPFRHLENRWTFVDVEGGGSDTGFWIDYEFKSPLLGLLMGKMFDTAFHKFAEAFETRARQVYGARQVKTIS